MKQPQHTWPVKQAKNRLGKMGLFFLLAGAFSAPLSGQITYTFTTAGATGSVGPTQAQVNTAYASTNLNGQVASAAGIQTWTVPSTGMYAIDIMGAAGGGVPASSRTGGSGARMVGEFSLTQGDVVKIIVGQMGDRLCNTGSGGGGTYVTRNNTLLIAAGGGGGAADSYNGVSGTTLTAGTADNLGLTVGGTNGSGGGTCLMGTGYSYTGGGGGGYVAGTAGNGVTDAPTAGTSAGGGGGFSFLNGGLGGAAPVSQGAAGGFGGGGGTQSCYVGGGGGGGYSGGAGGKFSSYCGSGNTSAGGGGGSYNAGTNQSNTIGANTGQGRVVINSLCNVNVSSTASLICTGTTVTLTTNAVSNYNWSNGNTTSSVIVVSPTITTTYTVSGMGTVPSGCMSSAAITVTVNNSPTLTVVSSTNSACLGQTVSLTASGANTYTWTGGITNGMTFTPSATSGYTVTGTNACGTASAAVTVTISALPISVAATSTLVCASRPTTLSAGGANTYTWMPGANTQTNYIVTPAANTIYTVTGTVGSCQGTNTISITTKANPTLSILATNTVICDGDAVSLTASGALTYTWNPVVSTNTTVAVSPTVSTLYSVIGTNSNNCTASISQVILVRPKPVVTATASDDLVCVGGASTLTASGANTYLWSNNAGTTVTLVNPTQTTTYSVTGTSTAGCVSGTVVTVSVFDPTLTVSSATAICRGTAVNISAGGMDSYQWSNGSVFSSISVSPTTTTTYSVQGSATQGIVTCTANGSVLVTVNQNPTLTATSSPTDMCKGQSAVLTAGGASTYTWAVPALSTGATLTVTPAADQTYTVAGEDANGCKGSKTVAVKVSACLGISANSLNAANLVIYPNPSAGDFTISSDQTIDLAIVNELGQLVRNISLNNNNRDVKVSNLANGVYFISGENTSGSVKQKIVVAK